MKYRNEVSFCLFRLASIYHGHISPKKVFDKGCNICDDLYCTRHRSSVSKEPWKDILITDELNESIESVSMDIMVANCVISVFDVF